LIETGVIFAYLFFNQALDLIRKSYLTGDVHDLSASRSDFFRRTVKTKTLAINAPYVVSLGHR
jgi:hypothetical protein